MSINAPDLTPPDADGAANGNDADSGLSRLMSTIGSLASSGSELASRLDFRSRDARREADIKRLGEALDRLSDRQLEVLSLSRAFLYSQLEDRYDALEVRKAAAASLTSGRDAADDETPKGVPCAD